jgi:Kef-type K+ transport system membrane component KefB
LTEHQLFLFLVAVSVIIVAARLSGELALRIGIPQVVGELLAGIALGPSLLG